MKAFAAELTSSSSRGIKYNLMCPVSLGPSLGLILHGTPLADLDDYDRVVLLSNWFKTGKYMASRGVINDFIEVDASSPPAARQASVPGCTPGSSSSATSRVPVLESTFAGALAFM